MPDPSPTNPDELLSPQARARREQMLPGLLAEVRRVRRRRTATKALAGAAVLALCSAVLFLAMLTPSVSSRTVAARSGTGSSTPVIPITPPVKVQFVQSPPDILERLAIRENVPALIEFIDTNQALGMLQSGGERYGFIEIAGRTEFLLIASK